MIIELDDQLVVAFVDWALLQPHCRPDEPLGHITRLLEIEMDGSTAKMLKNLQRDQDKTDLKLAQKALQRNETNYSKAHKVMTPEEYTALNLIGWHKVCKDIDGTGGIGIQYLPQSNDVKQSTTILGDELRELLQRSLDNFEDDIENKPMRHSIGNLIARLRAILPGRKVKVCETSRSSANHPNQSNIPKCAT